MPNEWCKEINGPRCVVTGCDASHEWMLQWWYKHYKTHNDYPVVFADFGMSVSARKWCKKRGVLIQINKKYKKNWFKKPSSILQSPYEIVIWVDLDCEVRKDLNPLFLHADKGVGVTKDPYTPFCKKHVKMGKAMATGVVVAKHGDPVIIQWANKVDAKHGSMRGDQEAFNSILNKIIDKLSIMPPEYQWLRRDGDNKDAFIMHWTGPRGKSHIRKKISPNARPKQRTVRSTPPASIKPPKPAAIKNKNKIQLKRQRVRILRKLQ